VSEGFTAQVDYPNCHVALKVRDFDAALRFYHAALGLPVLRRLGPADNPRSIFVGSIQLSRQTGEAGANPYGIFDHVGIAVKRIEDVCASLDRQGYTAETPLETRQIEGVGYPLKVAFYRDPDGNRVEILEHLTGG
jgi:catechol 2,3-dioxygenase-like lactoylglutathione lyase family enzyme